MVATRLMLQSCGYKLELLDTFHVRVTEKGSGQMGMFEYIAVLASIIIGLGITQLLQGFTRWDRRYGCKPDSPASVGRNQRFG